MRFFFLLLFSMGCGGTSKSVITYDTSSAQEEVDEPEEEEVEDSAEEEDTPEPEDTAEEPEPEPEPVYEYDLEITPNPIEFGPVSIGSTSTQVVTVKNVGSKSLHVNGISLSDSRVYAHRVIPEPPLTMAPETQLSVQVDFSPVGSEESAAEFTVITAESVHETGNLTSIPLRGRGDAAECEICAPIIDVSDNEVSLDAFLGCEATEAVTVTNLGDRPLRITGTPVVNDMFFTCGTFSAPPLAGTLVLNEMESHTIMVTFRATRACFEYLTLDSDENTLHILSNDPSEPDAVVNLEGLATCGF